MVVILLINGMLLIMLDVLVPIGNLCDFIFKVVNPLFTHQQCNENSHFAYTKLPCLGFLANLKLIRRHMFLAVFWSEQRLQFFQEPFRIWTL